MTTLDYCCRVQQALLALRPSLADDRITEWFADTGRASTAVTNAFECRNVKALRVAEHLARKWNLDLRKGEP
jgi:hypothetical protein